jgi:hypothetical protein
LAATAVTSDYEEFPVSLDLAPSVPVNRRRGLMITGSKLIASRGGVVMADEGSLGESSYAS